MSAALPAASFLPGAGAVWFDRSPRISPGDVVERTAESGDSHRAGEEARIREIVGSMSELLARLESTGQELAESRARLVNRPARAISSAAIGVAGAPRDATLDSLGAFAGVHSGTIQVNGVDVTIDVSRDSLADVVERLNRSDAGVRVTTWASGDRLSIRNRSRTSRLVLEDGGTGLFAAAQLSAGIHRPHVPDGVRAGRARELVESIGGLALQVEELLGRDGDSGASADPIGSIRAHLRDALQPVFRQTGPVFEADCGIGLDLSRRASAVMGLDRVDRGKLVHDLTTGGRQADVYELFLGRESGSRPGLVDVLGGALSSARDRLAAVLDVRGALVDFAA